MRPTGSFQNPLPSLAEGMRDFLSATGGASCAAPAVLDEEPTTRIGPPPPLPAPTRESPEEEAALARLLPGPRAQYTAVRQALRVACRPEANLALLRLLLEERLESCRTADGRQSLLDVLGRLALGATEAAPLLLADVVCAVNRPDAWACAAPGGGALALSCLALARRLPAEYARLGACLALEGRATLASGTEVTARVPTDSAPLGGISTLLTEALRPLARRLPSWGEGRAEGGLFGRRSQALAARMLEAMSGRPFHTHVAQAGGGWALDALADATARTRRGESPLVALESTGRTLHALVDGVHAGPQGTCVHLTLPSGEERLLSPADFLAGLWSYSHLAG